MVLKYFYIFIMSLLGLKFIFKFLHLIVNSPQNIRTFYLICIVATVNFLFRTLLRGMENFLSCLRSKIG